MVVVVVVGYKNDFDIQITVLGLIIKIKIFFKNGGVS